MNAVDELELEILHRTGDLDLAEHVGQAAHWAVTSLVDSLAAILCLPVETFDYEAIARTVIDPIEYS